jgi:hypothetical protein
MTKRILVLAAFAALAGASSAQGWGGQGRGGMMRMMQGSKMATLQLLGREDVQAEIKLNEAQKGKLDALRAGTRERFTTVFQSVPRTEDREAMMKAVGEKMQVLMDTMAKETLAVLEEDQKKRLDELGIQSAGTLAVLQADVAKQIGLTVAQKAKIEDLQRLQGEATQGVFERVQNGEIDREEIPTIMQKNSKIMDESVAKILTDAQRAKLKELGGAPFTFKDPKPGTPGSWARPGGG